MTLPAIPGDISYASHAIGIREKLRAATSAAHHALDERLSAFDLTETDHYRRFLQASAAALLPLECALEQAGVAELFADWSHRARAGVIAADLARLGGAVAPLPLPQPLNRIGIFGTLYVLEGSRLGAAYLRRIVAASADPRVRSATRYLGHGAGQGLWRSYLARLEREAVTAVDLSGMIASAQQAFAMFGKAVAAA
ncbi:putative heme oxygenase [Bradyrhizobium sp. STM 3843]|uniref:biliverdin-producing heme oxygenase n=1 Tax=Bradyrhizobium sp. STM 3843 TaxID=551947 RepID=UPI0002406C7F|nr:biliverdin-producing heme oxygenase [Bradyrhizobium sp. STM 3843]CCE06289.1 putative heme oxygenase [Bradyrhizobium sp. STM 3843]